MTVMTQSEGPTPVGEDAAREAVRQRLAHLRMSQRELATRSGVDKGTIGYYLGGRTTRPERRTIGAIEAALGWPLGTTAAIAGGADARPFINRTTEGERIVSESGRFVFDLPEGWDSGMSELERRAALRRAEAAALDALAQAQRSDG